MSVVKGKKRAAITEDDDPPRKKKRRNLSKEESSQVIEFYVLHNKNWNAFFRDPLVKKIQESSGYPDSLFFKLIQPKFELTTIAAIKNHVNYLRRKAKQVSSATGSKENEKVINELASAQQPLGISLTLLF